VSEERKKKKKKGKGLTCGHFIVVNGPATALEKGRGKDLRWRLARKKKGNVQTNPGGETQSQKAVGVGGKKKKNLIVRVGKKGKRGKKSSRFVGFSEEQGRKKEKKKKKNPYGEGKKGEDRGE